MSLDIDVEVEQFISSVLIDYKPPTYRRAVFYNGQLNQAQNFCCFYYFIFKKLSELEIEKQQRLRSKIFDFVANKAQQSSLHSSYKYSIEQLVKGIREDEAYNSLPEVEVRQNGLENQWLANVVTTYQPDYSGQFYSGRLHDSTFRFGAVSYQSFYTVAIIRLHLMSNIYLKQAATLSLRELVNGKNSLRPEYRVEINELLNDLSVHKFK
eukprot:TRINITY_DN8993_c0_g1_i1.p1 TRINITY_DN8993_c0_g1~~TRINITY_DN8993_c0_g1_i1.p1  ORF type:complete len:210 (-),score=87.40 TRINITY_DN8993_c0_g1_i1:88-717(-)